jgi:hypothetical protein
MFRSLGWDLCEPDVCHDLRLGLHHALQHPRKLFTQLGTGIEADHGCRRYWHSGISGPVPEHSGTGLGPLLTSYSGTGLVPAFLLIPITLPGTGCPDAGRPGI